jgi:hypothetical protein
MQSRPAAATRAMRRLDGRMRPRLQGSVFALCSRGLLLPRARCVVLLSFSPLRMSSVELRDEATSGHGLRGHAGPAEITFLPLALAPARPQCHTRARKCSADAS